MTSTNKNILHPFEIERSIGSLQCIVLEDILSDRWVDSCGHLIQLGMQAALEAKRGGHEQVQHTLTLCHKELEVVWHLLTAETWRLHLLPLLLDHSHDRIPISSLPFIMVLHSEVAALGLIENLVFHEESAAALEGLVLDVIDYSVRQLVRLATHAHTHPNQPLYSPDESYHSIFSFKRDNDRGEHSKKVTANDHGEKKEDDSQKTLKCFENPDGNEPNIHQEVSREERRAGLVLGAKAVAILHLLAGCQKHLPLCATTRLMNTHDVPQLLATLLYIQPWKAYHKDVMHIFEDSEWQERTPKAPPLSCTECQMWATLQTLLFDSDSIRMYEINTARRNVLLKLRGHLDEAALSQVPSLEHIARWLATLAISAPQLSHPPPLITTLPQLSEGVSGTWDGRWEELSLQLASSFLKPTTKCLQALASTMAAAWDLDALEELLPHPPMCTSCGGPASQRCSRCHNQWYCNRKCQVKDWPQHKKVCDLLVTCHSKTDNAQGHSASSQK
ncbi:zinc finger MYND domain-containing protein 10-like isoform X2 [Portunus trituberculatus]|uniref:zinc finger MYND domain-containing protein 10-like isoform X2 n=1 Tax=Portunus trituberculatus TaxID=210409 RepID=UPI001E1CB1B3|nr:zinc finger MYND domain-containing protein 10-like isoform X2 [Portunus trituberculatus]